MYTIDKFSFEYLKYVKKFYKLEQIITSFSYKIVAAFATLWIE